jgi:excisionase family DNA binding protein
LVKAQPIEELKKKEFLTVRDAAILLNCSIRTAYRLIEHGNIKAVNIAEKKTLIVVHKCYLTYKPFAI